MSCFNGPLVQNLQQVQLQRRSTLPSSCKEKKLAEPLCHCCYWRTNKIHLNVNNTSGTMLSRWLTHFDLWFWSDPLLFPLFLPVRHMRVRKLANAICPAQSLLKAAEKNGVMSSIYHDSLSKSRGFRMDEFIVMLEFIHKFMAILCP